MAGSERVLDAAGGQTVITWLVALSWSVLALGGTAGRSEQTCWGRGDINADAAVNAADLAAFAACLAGPEQSGPPECSPAQWPRADLEGDNDVDLRDYGELMQLAGTAYFNYGPRRDNLEAELLAMELRGTLRAANADYNRILRDLGLIRAAYPELATVIEDPEYVPNQLIVKLIDGQPTGGYEALNSYYQLVNEEIYSWGRVLTFCDNLNAAVLAEEYDSLPEVQYANPNWMIGYDDEITVTDAGLAFNYLIDDGFWDCFDGCDCHRVWTFNVDWAGHVVLVSYEEYGMPWCEF
jgi:hypothetical protein